MGRSVILRQASCCAFPSWWLSSVLTAAHTCPSPLQPAAWAVVCMCVCGSQGGGAMCIGSDDALRTGFSLGQALDARPQQMQTVQRPRVFKAMSGSKQETFPRLLLCDRCVRPR